MQGVICHSGMNDQYSMTIQLYSYHNVNNMDKTFTKGTPRHIFQQVVISP